ncbi:ABC transporter permease [Brooklawnia cerclae]|uniref:Peptide/nickel transport system permease protein n=1 Tax=Brooklawnia cerclae TaxID=349934 RepID=A0ABX0SI13_9ACTN|nr:ABC transporter permease [Brooklawnia cerclae]NIH57601.1 peptide/nickel transport system permease protein [Brooklawnia cerclae]
MSWYERNRWWVLRLIRLPIDIFVFATLAFFLIRLLPGDPVAVALATRSDPVTPELEQTLRVEMGLDGTLWDQLLRFWAGLLHGDLGTSLETGIPVTQEVLSRLPATVEIILLGLGGAFTATMILGFCYIRFANDKLRRGIRLISSFATSVPVFVVAIFGIIIFYVVLHWLPAPLGRVASGTLPVVTGFPLLDEALSGRWDLLGQTLIRYILPVGAMVLTYTPNLLTQFIGGLDRELTQTATRFQVAAGARRPWIYFSVMRRSVSSVVVIFGLFFGALIGGAVVIESLFGFGGLGQLGVRAVGSVDFPALQGFLILIVAFCLVMFLLVDLVNMWLDPRRRPGVASEGK